MESKIAYSCEEQSILRLRFEIAINTNWTYEVSHLDFQWWNREYNFQPCIEDAIVDDSSTPQLVEEVAYSRTPQFIEEEEVTYHE